MSDNNRAYVWVTILPGDGSDSNGGLRFVLTNRINDEVTVRNFQDPDVEEFVMQSVLANPRYTEIDWQDRRDFARVEAQNALANLRTQFELLYGVTSPSQIPQVLQEQYSSGRSPVPLLGPLGDTLAADTASTTTQQGAGNNATSAMLSTPAMPPALAMSSVAAMPSGTAMLSTPAMSSGTAVPSMPAMPFGTAMPWEPENVTGGEMVLDAAPASGGSNAEDADLSPFVAGARARLTEEQWVHLMRVVSELFLADWQASQLSGQPHRSKMDLMRDALLDPRIVNSETDYSISRRQFDGQLYERKLVGWSADVIEHTREALRTGNFTKPEDRKNRRRKVPKSVLPSDRPHDLSNGGAPPPPPPAPTAV